MFGTVVRDVFVEDEKGELHEAIEMMCSPDSYGWASVGIYCFYDPDLSEIGRTRSPVLYIGLARDLPERFAQHVGIIQYPKKSCKRRQIKEWFDSHERLGYSCFVQSVLGQVNTHRERARFSKKFHDEERDDWLGSHPTEGLESTKSIEGTLIEAHRIVYSKRPCWNAIGGSVAGASLAAGGGLDDLLPILGGVRDSALLARSTFRELLKDSNFAEFESSILHAARVNLIMKSGRGGTYAPSLVDELRELAASSIYNRHGFSVGDQVKDVLQSGYLNNSS
jgi:hypothetical protein